MKRFSIKEGITLQALWVGIGSFGAFVVGIISAAIFSRFFEKTEYGTYRQILFIYNTLLVIFTAGLPRVYAYYLPKVSLEQGKSIVGKITIVLFLLGLIFSLFLFFASGIIADVLANPDLKKGLKLFSPVPMLLLPTLGIEGIFSTYKKAHFIAIFSILTRTILLICIVLPVILFDKSYVYAIYGYVVGSFITLIIAYYFKGIPYRGSSNEKSTLRYKEIFTYSLPIAIASFWGIAYKAAEQFYVSRFFGAEVFAEFSNGFIQLPFVAMVTGATSTVLMPEFTRMIHNKVDIERLSDLWRSALVKSAIIIYPLVVFFMYCAKTFMVLLFSSEYENSTIYFQIAMILNFFNIIVFAPLLFSMGKTKLYSKGLMIVALTGWALGYLVVIVFNSPIAIAVMSISGSILMAIFFIAFISKMLKVSLLTLFPLKKFSIIIFHSIAAIGIIHVFKLYFYQGLGQVATLIIDFSGFSIILASTSKMINLDYFGVIKSIVKRG